MNNKQNSKSPEKIWSPEEQGIGKTKLQASLTDPKLSALKKYQDLTVGSYNILRLFKY